MPTITASFHIEESSSRPKSQVWLSRLDHWQLPGLHVVGLLGAGCPPPDRLGAQSARRDLLSSTPLRTAPPHFHAALHSSPNCLSSEASTEKEWASGCRETSEPNLVPFCGEIKHWGSQPPFLFAFLLIPKCDWIATLILSCFNCPLWHLLSSAQLLTNIGQEEVLANTIHSVFPLRPQEVSEL